MHSNLRCDKEFPSTSLPNLKLLKHLLPDKHSQRALKHLSYEVVYLTVAKHSKRTLKHLSFEIACLACLFTIINKPGKKLFLRLTLNVRHLQDQKIPVSYLTVTQLFSESKAYS
jgi:hypothetical protein